MNDTGDALHAVIPVLQERERRASARVDSLKEQLDAAMDELVDTRTALNHIERLAGIDRPAAQAQESRFSWLSRDPDGHAPEGLEAVSAVLRQAPVPLTLEALTEAVAELGWRPQTDEPERAVRAAANRLRKKDQEFDYIDRKFLFRPRHVVSGPRQAAFLTDGEQ